MVEVFELKTAEDTIQEVQYLLDSIDWEDDEKVYKVATLIVEPVWGDDQYFKDIDEVIEGKQTPQSFYEKYFGSEIDPNVERLLEFLKENGY